jgi:hypothetical protein
LTPTGGTLKLNLLNISSSFWIAFISGLLSLLSYLL